MDNLQLALANAKEKADDPFVKGVQLVHDTLLKSLKDHGAEPFDSVGLDLDTERMEAIATLPNPQMENNTIMHVERRGFVYENGDVVGYIDITIPENFMKITYSECECG